jgi:hypothetical protein
VGLLGVLLVIQSVLGLLAPLLVLLQVHPMAAAAAGGGKTFSAKVRTLHIASYSLQLLATVLFATQNL